MSVCEHCVNIKLEIVDTMNIIRIYRFNLQNCV